MWEQMIRKGPSLGNWVLTGLWDLSVLRRGFRPLLFLQERHGPYSHGDVLASVLSRPPQYVASACYSSITSQPHAPVNAALARRWSVSSAHTLFCGDTFSHPVPVAAP